MEARKPKSPLPTEIVEAANRVYVRDPQRYHKLVVWIHAARANGWPDALIVRALGALNLKLSKGEAVAEWWPFLQHALSYIARKVENERAAQHARVNDGYKHGDLTSFRSILKRLAREI